MFLLDVAGHTRTRRRPDVASRAGRCAPLIYLFNFKAYIEIIIHGYNTWMTSMLLTSCRKKDKMYLKYKKISTPANRSRYIQFRNIFIKVKIQAEKLYYENEFLKYNHDIRKTWRIIKKNYSVGKNVTRL